MKTDYTEEKKEVKRIYGNRERTSILIEVEKNVVFFFIRRMPSFVTSNLLTFIGFLGSLSILAGFILAKYVQSYFLFLCVLGLFINWFGDSLDGRLAYYRNIPRKWFGFSLDIIMDWVSTILIGLGYYFYASEKYKIIGFLIVVLYGWAMIITQLRYKITGQYTIDSGIMGPTEVRVILAIIITIEYFFPHTLKFFAGGICPIFLVINIVETRKLLKDGNVRDEAEKKAKQEQIQ